MERTICEIKVVFNGLYEWGSGWNTETKNKWNEYWKKRKGLFWHFVEVDNFNKTQYLVGTAGSFYMHPMGFDGILVGGGVVSSYRKSDGTMGESCFNSEIEEIYEACKGCVEYCGGSFRMEVSDEVKMDMPHDLHEYSK